MGKSRRRLKKSLPKVRVGIVRRKITQKAKKPHELSREDNSTAKRLGEELSWKETNTLVHNYEQLGLVLDPNEGFGRNHTAPPVKTKEEREAAQEETYSDDDEFRALCSKVRKTGKAQPPRLTSHQRQIIQRLIAKHGDDVEAMVRDTKLNSMLHSAGKLKEMIAAFQFWGQNSGHDFWPVNKRPKKLI